MAYRRSWEEGSLFYKLAKELSLSMSPKVEIPVLLANLIRKINETIYMSTLSHHLLTLGGVDYTYLILSSET